MLYKTIVCIEIPPPIVRSVVTGWVDTIAKCFFAYQYIGIIGRYIEVFGQIGAVFYSGFFYGGKRQCLFTCILTDIVGIVKRRNEKERFVMFALQKIYASFCQSEIIVTMKILETKSIFARKRSGMYMPLAGVGGSISGLFYKTT